jgi:hypothetical protein
MQDVGCELRRIPIPRTWVNKGKKKGLQSLTQLQALHETN